MMHKLGMFAALMPLMLGTTVQAAPQLSYSIALQNEHGVETQALDLAIGGAVHKLVMAGGTVEVTPPASSAEPSILRLYAEGQGETRVLHTASIRPADGRLIRIAYSLCGGKVTYQSQAPDKLISCAAQAK